MSSVFMSISCVGVISRVFFLWHQLPEYIVVRDTCHPQIHLCQVNPAAANNTSFAVYYVVHVKKIERVKCEEYAKCI